MAFSRETLASLIKVQDEIIVQSPGWYADLKVAINDLILNDFGKLVQVLYQADVSEEKLKRLLNDNSGTDAGTIIANLLLERQLQKLRAKAAFQSRPPATDEDKW